MDKRYRNGIKKDKTGTPIGLEHLPRYRYNIDNIEETKIKY